MSITITAPRSRFSDSVMTRRRQSQIRIARRKGAMGEMNVTPFIDVLLVLLVMLILAVPVRFNVTPVDLPNGEPCLTCEIRDDANTVHITAKDELMWNAQIVTPEQLGTQIAKASAIDNPPLLRFAPDPSASYDQSSRTIALIKDSGAKNFAFIGNEQHDEFGR